MNVFFSRRVTLMNRRVTQMDNNKYFKSAKLSVKICETQREIFKTLQ